MNYSQATGLKDYSIARINTKRRPYPASTAYLVFFLLLTLSNACTNSVRLQTPPLNTTVSATENTDIKPLPFHPDQNLTTVLDQLLQTPDYSQARWGLTFISLKDGKVIYDHNGAQFFTPASNMKLYTTAVSLDLLGRDYRWRTSVYSDNEPDPSGTLHGDLILYGRGSPDLVGTNKKDDADSLDELAKLVAARGVKRIEGNVIGDESYFRGDATGEGWQWNDLQWYFGADASALSVNANSIEIKITPALKLGDSPTITTSDIDGYVHTTNNLISVERGQPIRFGIKRELAGNDVVVWGQYPVGATGYSVNLSVNRPSLWAATIFLHELKRQGISIVGGAQFRDSRMAEKNRFNPDGKRELAFVTSKPLADIIKTTNKLSVNLYAELLLRTVGRERGAMLPAQPPKGRERGDDETGRDLIQLWLTRQGINTSGLALHDGSGLSRLDLVSPQITVQLLDAIRKTNSSQTFTESLPIAGTDGTLGSRLRSLQGRIVAKTGSLVYDNSLSGYLTTTTGEVFAFSVICNDFTGQTGSIRLIDRLLLTASEYLDSKPSSPKAQPSPR